MAKRAKPPQAEPSLDPAAAEKAFQALLPRLQSLAPDNLVALNTDLEEAAIRALSVSRFLSESEPLMRFGLLSPKIFDPKHLADLGPIALAAYHTSNALRSARATSTEAKIPAGLAEEAATVKARMIKLCGYAFDDNPALSAELADIRLGTGYKDLANDLGRLAKIYIAEHATLSKDVLTYRKTDADEARKLAQRILVQLGEARSKDETKWIDLAGRAWTLLREIYDEVQAAGLFLYRREDAAKKFPSLYAVHRGRARKEPSEASPAAPGSSVTSGDGP